MALVIPTIFPSELNMMKSFAFSNFRSQAYIQKSSFTPNMFSNEILRGIRKF